MPAKLTITTLLVAAVLQASGLAAQTADVHMSNARAALQAGDVRAAKIELLAVSAANPKNLEAVGDLAILDYFAQHWKDAADRFERVLAQKPDDAKTQALLGICRENLGQTNVAGTLLEDALPKLPSGKVSLQAGLALLEIYYRERNLGPAVELVRRLENQAPKNPDVLFAAYRIYSDLALHERDSLAALEPDSARMHLLIAQHLVNRGDINAAVAQYRKALSIDSGLRGVHYEIAEALLTDGKNAQSASAARSELLLAQSEQPMNAAIENKLGLIAERGGDLVEAAKHYSRALELEPSNIEGSKGLGTTLAKLNRNDQALPYLERSASANEEDAAVHYRLAMVYRAVGREAESNRELAAVRKLKANQSNLERVYGEMKEISPPANSSVGDDPER